MSQQALNEKINELLEDPRIKSLKQLKRKLRRLLTQVYETNDVRMKSTKILNYLVNDILDFAQMKSGKFRKQNQYNDFTETIDQIFNIQQYKAE
jgi:signal transduction histidine kinase